MTTRNRSILLGYLELFFDLASLYFYISRRGGVVLVITLFNFIFWGIGMWATIRLHYYGLMSHAIYSMSVVGGFYIWLEPLRELQMNSLAKDAAEAKAAKEDKK